MSSYTSSYTAAASSTERCRLSRAVPLVCDGLTPIVDITASSHLADHMYDVIGPPDRCCLNQVSDGQLGKSNRPTGKRTIYLDSDSNLHQ